MKASHIKAQFPARAASTVKKPVMVSGGSVVMASLPTGPGNQPSLKKNRKVSIRPSQKKAMDDPSTATTLAARSIQVSRRAAATMPTGTPARTARSTE